MNLGIELSVIVSCFNESGNVATYPETLFPFLLELKIPFELILVDDGSTDGTAQIIRDFQNKYSYIVGAYHTTNKGLGAGLRTGFSIARGSALLTMDADLTFHPRQISQMLATYHKGFDVVLGSPLLGKMEGVHPVRFVLSQAINKIYEVVLGQKITSMSSIFRVYNRELIRSLTLSSTAFDINSEVMFKLLRRGVTFTEIPVKLSRRLHGESKLNFLREIWNHLIMVGHIIRWRFINN